MKATRLSRTLQVVFCFLMCLWVAPNFAAAQNRVHVGLGYNQSYAQLDSFNYVLNAFNAENTWVSKPMHEIHASSGITGHVGADFNRVLVDLQYTMRFAATNAKSLPSQTNPPTQQQIQVHYNASTIDMGVGYFFVRKARVRIATGASLDFGNTRVSYRRGQTPSVSSLTYSRIVNELNVGVSGYFHIMIAFQDGVGPGIFIRPYYQQGLRNNYFAPFNRAIRPSTGLADSPYIMGTQSNIGLKVGVFFGS
jgi:hypothetical protein